MNKLGKMISVGVIAGASLVGCDSKNEKETSSFDQTLELFDNIDKEDNGENLRKIVYQDVGKNNLDTLTLNLKEAIRFTVGDRFEIVQSDYFADKNNNNIMDEGEKIESKTEYFPAGSIEDMQKTGEVPSNFVNKTPIKRKIKSKREILIKNKEERKSDIFESLQREDDDYYLGKGSKEAAEFMESLIDD